MDFGDFLINTIPNFSIEFLAALFGTFYLKKTVHTKQDFYLVLFLWFILGIDMLGAYPSIAYYSDYTIFGFVKDTPFIANYWLFNSSLIILYLFYAYYFRAYIKDEKWKKLISWLMILFGISTVTNLTLTDIYFNGYAKLTILFGAFLIFVSVVLFYLELLKSDHLLKIKRFLPFYISVGILLFYLATTPLDVLTQYFKKEYPLFVSLRVYVIFIFNLILYNIFILGFILCARKKKSY